MSMKDQIRAKLEAAFTPAALEIIDDSHKHAHHHHNPGGGETHFTVKVTSNLFVGKRLVERHRLINQALASELAGQVHALAIEARVPGE